MTFSDYYSFKVSPLWFALGWGQSFEIFMISLSSPELNAALYLFPTVAHLSYPPWFFSSYDIIECNTSMISGRRIGREIALLAVLSVLAVFLFPGVRGPYSVVHGPASALQRPSRSSLGIRHRTIRLDFTPEHHSITPGGTYFDVILESEFQPTSLPEYSSILRC